MPQNRATYIFLLCLTLVALYGCYLLVAPFGKPIVFAAVAAILFQPVHLGIRRRVKNRTLAALCTTVIVVLLIILCSVLLGRAIAIGVHEIYDSLNVRADGRERLGAYLVSLSERIAAFASHYFPLSAPDLRGAVGGQAQKVVAMFVNSATVLAGKITVLFVNALISFFILFFLFRDGRQLLRRAYILLPLTVNQWRRLCARIEETLQAIVYGSIAMAAVQGALTGVGFWILGVSSPILWAIVTTLCALVPVIGTGFVLVPAISMLLFSGHWVKALILLAWGLVVVHPIDNVLRPYLIGERTQLSTLFVFFAILGGLRTFGAMGVFIGPIILATTFALVSFLREENQHGHPSFEAPSSESPLESGM
ncbi:MAG: AI-2E family transporter [Candidatus Acidiferrum sp.]